MDNKCNIAIPTAIVPKGDIQVYEVDKTRPLFKRYNGYEFVTVAELYPYNGGRIINVKKVVDFDGYMKAVEKAQEYASKSESGLPMVFNLPEVTE